MLNRQKALLFMLQQAGRPVDKMELTKWAFLLRNESDSGGGSAFYDFVPYRYGPFSFSLYREIAKLGELGYLRELDEQTIELVSDVTGRVESPGARIERDIAALIDRYSGLTRKALVDHVYSEYPAFTVNSEIKKLRIRVVAKPAVYTAGYEGLSIDAFLSMLVTNGIKRLIDVRNNPVARRYGFHSSTLERLTGNLGIEYRHFPELGIKSARRRNLKTKKDYKALFEEYERKTVRAENAAVEIVASLMRENASVLVCMEKEPKYCHRSRLAARISELTSLPVEHLRYERANGTH